MKSVCALLFSLSWPVPDSFIDEEEEERGREERPRNLPLVFEEREKSAASVISRCDHQHQALELFEEEERREESK